MEQKRLKLVKIYIFDEAIKKFQDLMFNIGGLGKDMNEFSVMIMYFISSRSQVIFDLENLIIENKKQTNFFLKIELSKKEKTQHLSAKAKGFNDMIMRRILDKKLKF